MQARCLTQLVRYKKNDSHKGGIVSLPTAPEGATLFGWFWDLAQEAISRPELLALVYPEQVDQFECSQCAQCCQQPWNIELDADYYDHWYATFDNHPSGRFKNPFLPATENTRAVLNKQPGSNRCLFLDQDNLCFIHKEYGAEAKPEICQRYPHEASLHGNLYSPSLKSSCKTAARMLEETGELVLRMVKRPAQWELTPVEPLQPWIGLLLEGIWQHSISPVRCLAGSVFSLKQISANPLFLTDLDLLSQLYHGQVQAWRQDTGPKAPRWSECLELFAVLDPFRAPALERFLAKLKEGGRLPFAVSESERQHLGAVVRNYLTRRLLNLNPLQAKGLTLFQFAFLQAFSLLAVQVQALCLAWYSERRLTPEILVAALNQVETAVLQNPAWFDRHRMNQLDTATCLDAITVATTLDLCLPEYGA